MTSNLEATFMYIPMETPVVLQGAVRRELKVFNIILGFLKSMPQEILVLQAFIYLSCKNFLKLVTITKSFSTLMAKRQQKKKIKNFQQSFFFFYLEYYVQSSLETLKNYRHKKNKNKNDATV